MDDKGDRERLHRCFEGNEVMCFFGIKDLAEIIVVDLALRVRANPAISARDNLYLLK